MLSNGKHRTGRTQRDLPLCLQFHHGRLATKHSENVWTVPRSIDKEKSALSQKSGELHGLAPDLKRSEAVF